MSAQVTIDKAGRIVLPKRLRDQLRLDPGAMLEICASRDVITLRPARQTMFLRKERAVWVYRSGRRADASTIENLLAELREDRSRDLRR